MIAVKKAGDPVTGGKGERRPTAGQHAKGEGLLRKRRSMLIVDDEPKILSTNQRMLKDLGCEFKTADNGKEALEMYEEGDIVLSDLNMPVMDGLEMLKELKRRDPDAIVIMHTTATEGDKKALVEAGAVAVFDKPADPSELSRAVQACLEQNQ